MTWSKAHSNNLTASSDRRGGGGPQFKKKKISVGNWQHGGEEDAVIFDFGLSKPCIILFQVPPLFSVLRALHPIDTGVNDRWLRYVL